MSCIKYALYYSGYKTPELRNVKYMRKYLISQNRLNSHLVKSVNRIEVENLNNEVTTSTIVPDVNKFHPQSTVSNNSTNDPTDVDKLNNFTNNVRLSNEPGNNKRNINHGPELSYFISKQNKPKYNFKEENIPYLQPIDGNQQKVYFEIYGCQMNVNDTEVVSAILEKHNYKITKTVTDANIILLVTCAIRDSAEEKVWNKLRSFRLLKKYKKVSKVGLLGCMAERLKRQIIEREKIVDIVAGPDSYKDLPRLLSINNDHEAAINVALSHDETYADVMPVRLNPESKTAYVSIMRGCDNMCTYCIVPFTRGKERSRPIRSILDEVAHLSDQGVKEVTLLGQNVNSYRDLSESHNLSTTILAQGFKTVYKNKIGGLRFGDLLDKVSLVNPEMRIRFTSPHPKDFPDDVLHLIAERPNICKQIHLPAQSGSSNVLRRMRRGYSREAYLNLVHHIRSIIPDIAFSSDFIVGFCDETEDEFSETLSLVKEVKYHCAFLFPYSMREKTTAHRRYQDNVDFVIKHERLKSLIDLYRSEVSLIFKKHIGQHQLVLVEGKSKRSDKDFQGRNDANVKVVFPNMLVPTSSTSATYAPIEIGNYIVTQICNATSQTLIGIPLYHSSIKEFHQTSK